VITSTTTSRPSEYGSSTRRRSSISRRSSPSARIERHVDEETFEVVTVEETGLASRLQDNDNLSDTDVAVLACAAARDGGAVMDEAAGRDVVTTESITTRGTYITSCHWCLVEKSQHLRSGT
jgi:hypothetical protein